MKKLLTLVMVLSFAFLFTIAAHAAQPDKHGFDEFGYNRTARNFVGTCLSWRMAKNGADEVEAAEYCGIYSNDKLKMSWNAEWDRGNAEGWSDPEGYKGARTDNQWNGMKDGSGEVWHYKFKWVGTCGTPGTVLDSGGYCIWGQFETMMDHGTFDGAHTWYAHGIPSGYGAY